MSQDGIKIEVVNRWSAVLARLAEGPAAYGPHDVEALCDALQRVVAERDRLLRVLAVERGDATQAPPGWRRDMHGVWIRPGCFVGPGDGCRWRVWDVRHAIGGRILRATCDTALEAMEAADEMDAKETP